MMMPTSDTEAREEAVDREVALEEPMPHQQPIFLDPARYKVLICGRRFGKTSVGLPMALVGHGPEGARRGALYGAYIWWVMPTIPQARDTWDAFELALKDVWVRKNATEKFFDLPGGGRLQIKSSDKPETLRGSGLNGIVIDEIKDHKRATWKNLRPTLADKHGWLLAMGTPGPPDLDSLAYYLHQRGQNRKGWKVWQEPTSSNPLVTPAELEEMRDELGAIGFQRECLAQFVTYSGGMIRAESFKFFEESLEGPVVDGRLTRLEACQVFVSCDLAISTKTWADYTVAVVWAKTPEGKLLVLDVLREKIEGPQVVRRLADLMERWKAGALWTAEFGPLRSLVLEAKAHGLPVREAELPPGMRKKVEKAEPLIAAIEAGRVLFRPRAPWFDTVKIELCGFPDPDLHDDIVDAMALGPIAAPAPKVKWSGVKQPIPRPRKDPRNVRKSSIWGDDDGRGSIWG